MNGELEKAIETLANQIEKDMSPDHALKYTQAALNLAHAREIMQAVERRGQGIR